MNGVKIEIGLTEQAPGMWMACAIVRNDAGRIIAVTRYADSSPFHASMRAAECATRDAISESGRGVFQIRG